MPGWTIYRVQLPDRDMTFNSLFEMPVAGEAAYRGEELSLSILYLRCCEYNCGPILVMNTDIGEMPAPPCHGAERPACAGRVLFPDLCTMIKAAGCRSPYTFENAYYYSVSVLDFSNRVYEIREVKLMVDNLPLALYSFGTSPERKAREEILYLYMIIAFPYDFAGGEPPPGAE